MNKKRLFLIWIAVALISFVFFVVGSQVRANGGTFTLNFSGTKLIDVGNAVPGQIETKSFSVVNNEASEKSIHIFGRGAGADGLNDVLTVEITGGSSVFSMPMDSFLALPDSDVPGNLFDTLGPSETKDYTFKVTMASTAGNEYQGLESVFDVTFGVKTGTVESAYTEGPGVLSQITNLPDTGAGNIVLISLLLVGSGTALKYLEKFGRKSFKKGT